MSPVQSRRLAQEVEDTYGDSCLAALAARLKAEFSGHGELPARLGGEEFGVVLDGQGVSVAAQRAERFRESLALRPIEVDGTALPVTVSICVAEFDWTLHRDGDGLYRAADHAVYRAKSAGRNRICLHLAALA